MLINDDGLIFYPYRREGDWNVHFALLQISPGQDPTFSASLVSVDTFTNTGIKSSDYRFNHLAVPDGFLFVWSNSTEESEFGLFKFDVSGEIRQVHQRRPLQLFEFQGEQYVINIFCELLRSRDNGETWNLVFTFDSISALSVRWQEVDNQLFGRFSDQVFLAVLKEGDFSARMLDTEELAYQTITHIAKLGNKAVLYTSAGIYTRDWEEFLAE